MGSSPTIAAVGSGFTELALELRDPPTVRVGAVRRDGTNASRGRSRKPSPSRSTHVISRAERANRGRLPSSRPSDHQVLEGGSVEEQAQLIEQRLLAWKSAANVY